MKLTITLLSSTNKAGRLINKYSICPSLRSGFAFYIVSFKELADAETSLIAPL